MQSYRVEIIRTLDRWQELSLPWNDLLEQSSSNTIFLSWEWLFSWAECYLNRDRELFILAVYENEELLGVAPWYLSRQRVYRFIKYSRVEFLGTPESASDYLDVFIRRGKEKEVAYRIYDFLLREARSSWDCLTFRDVPVESPFFFHFMNRIEEEGKYAEIGRGSTCPISSRPTGTDDLFQNVSQHRRKRFNRELKLLTNDGGIDHRSISSGEEFTDALRELFSFHEKQKEFKDKQLYLFLEKFIARCRGRNIVEIDLLTHQGKSIAGLLHLRHRDTLSLYLMVTDKGFNPKISIGNVLVGLSMKRAFEGDIATYDFLKGSEQYKFSWANGMRSSMNVFVYGKKMIPLFLVAKRFLKHTAKVILR